jgi:hypothetical protein
MSVFLTYVSRFKEDIFLAMDAKSPTDVPPSFLPASIASFLAKLCDLSDETIDALWDILKGVVWSWKEKMQTIEVRYQLYSHNLGYRRFFCDICSHRMISCWLGVLYPPSHFCVNEACSRMHAKQKLQKVEQRRAILYTLGEGVHPLWVMTLYCPGNVSSLQHSAQ